MTAELSNAHRRDPGKRERAARFSLESLEARRVMSGFANSSVATTVPLKGDRVMQHAELARATPQTPVTLPSATPQAAVSPPRVTLPQALPVTAVYPYYLDSKSHDLWMHIGGTTYEQVVVNSNTTQIVKVGSSYFALDGVRHKVAPVGSSTPVGDDVTQIVSAQGRLFALNSLEHRAYVYNGPGANPWTLIAGNVTQIVSVGDRLYTLDSLSKQAKVYENGRLNDLVLRHYGSDG